MFSQLTLKKIPANPLQICQMIGERARAGLNAVKNIPLADWFNNDQIYIFHHLPKCAGTSVNHALANWFWVLKEHPHVNGTNGTIRHRRNLAALRNCHCLSGHFDVDGKYLHQLHPEVLQSSRFKLFTFVRNPLQTKISLFYHEKRYQIDGGATLKEHLMGRTNYLSHRFPCTEDNYQEVLNRYFFIGITEYAQQSLDKLARLLKRPPVQLPLLNRSKRDHEVETLTADSLEQFREENRLDYLIYEYCLERFSGGS